MPYKSLQQLRDEQKVHHERAMRLIREASEIFKLMKTINPFSPEYMQLREQWLGKDKQARAETSKSVELTNQFIQELERLKNRDLN